jgi:hypothetical protein
MTDYTLDLDAARKDRAETRAARHEGRGDELPIKLGGQVIATVGAEFPMSVLEPLTAVNVDIAYLVRAFAQMMDKSNADAQAASIALMVDVLAANPQLPAEIIAAVKDMARRVLGDDGYEAFVELQPSPWDCGTLAKGLLDWWGVSLGESQPSPPPLDGGETSKPTSNGSTGSTRGASGKPRARKGS